MVKISFLLDGFDLVQDRLMGRCCDQMISVIEHLWYKFDITSQGYNLHGATKIDQII